MSKTSVPSYGATGIMTNNNDLEKQLSSGVIPINDVSDPIATSSLPPGPTDSMTRMLLRLRGIPCAGILLAMLSGMFFAFAGFIVKLIPEVNPIEIVICR